MQQHWPRLCAMFTCSRCMLRRPGFSCLQHRLLAQSTFMCLPCSCCMLRRPGFPRLQYRLLAQSTFMCCHAHAVCCVALSFPACSTGCSGHAHVLTTLTILLCVMCPPGFPRLQWFEDMGGFVKEENNDLFVDYCRRVFGWFGQKIKLWATFNEPTVGMGSKW